MKSGAEASALVVASGSGRASATGRRAARLARSCAALLLVLPLGCATAPGAAGPRSNAALARDPLALANRVSWGATPSLLHHIDQVGVAAYLDEQLRPAARAMLPPAAQQQVDALAAAGPLAERMAKLDAQRRAADGVRDDDEKMAAQQVYQQALNQLQRDAASRFLLRALYADSQLQEQLTWFWFNHFNVHAGKHDLRAMIGDYEDTAIRAHALGRFRDLLAATVHHPAMLRYLDNEQNALGHANENYARELMELHTLGVDGGYTQKDVQELARVLTGYSVRVGGETPRLRGDLQGQYRRDGLVEFNPARHDYGSKQFLGHTIAGRGAAELDEALDILARHPSTARFVCRQLATYLVSDTPSDALVEQLAQAFRKSDGDIAATLRVLFASDEFARSLGHKFRDPVHYALAAVRYAYDDKVILNAEPLLNWLNRLGEPLYGRQTPDGYPAPESAWASPGQMATRFEIARVIGSGSAGLFKPPGQNAAELPAFPQLANELYYRSLRGRLRPATADALEQARSPQEWGALLLASPDMMYR